VQVIMLPQGVPSGTGVPLQTAAGAQTSLVVQGLLSSQTVPGGSGVPRHEPLLQ